MNENLSFPKIIQIETTTICPASCIMCPQKFVSRPKFMPMPIIEKIIDECAGKEVTIIPHQMGDPLADPRIMTILKKCKHKRLKILMSTTGFLLDKRKAEELVNLQVDTINISFDSLNKKIYEKTRKISFDKVTKNIKDLISLKRSPSTEVWISAVDMFFNKVTRCEFINYWKPLVDNVQVCPYVRYPKIRNWRLPRKKFKNIETCSRLETDMVILSNGKASKCCIDFEGTTSFGNIENQGIHEVWNGSERKNFIEKLKLYKRKRFYPCNICAI